MIESLTIRKAENGTVVECTYKKESSSESDEQPEHTYEHKTYTGSPDLMEKILSEVDGDGGGKKKSVKKHWK